ncbi:MAG: MMPL family transporter [Polyangiaceae bacterium]|nr:MMPL family transporter [Polyangiaceae bacterium]
MLHHRIKTLVITGVLIVAALALVLHGGQLSSGTVRNTEAGRAQDLVTQVTGHAEEATFVAIFTAKRPEQTAADITRAADEAVAALKTHQEVANVVTPTTAPGFLSADMVNPEMRTVLAYVTLRGDVAQALKAYPDIRKALRSNDADITCTGHVPFVHDMNQTLKRDLIRAELIAIPLALLVLVLVFRTLVAAALPVGVGGLAVLGGIGIVLGLSHTTDIAIYTKNVCSLIGLGVSIDYSLFLVSRYREELDHGYPTNEAILRAMTTAGRTIAFSGLAVCTGLAGLFFFAGSYLLPMGIGGVIVVMLAVTFALTTLPALLSVLGPRIFLGRVHLRRRRRSKSGAPISLRMPRWSRGLWARIALYVMKRPLLVGVPTLLVLLAIGAPFLHIQLAAADVHVLDGSIEARRGYELLKRTLPDQARNRVVVAVEFPTSPALTPARVDALYDLTKRLEKTPNVTKVQSLFGGREGMSKDEVRELILDPPVYAQGTIEEAKALTVGDRVVLIHALTDATSDTEAARSIVRTLRTDRGVADGAFVVGGDIAHDVDATDFILSRTPHAVAFVVCATLILLFLLLRSVLLPIKAVLMNFLSMAGSFGALVHIFQDGNFGVREPRPLEPTLPVLLFCVLFGLSMDYEVLLLSRIREAYRRTNDNTGSVAEGLQKTANLITSAAAIMVSVFVAFAFADVVMIQAVGVGMALAVTLDATLVRTLLVPATMRLMGDLNWWAPQWLWRNHPPKPPPPPATPIRHSRPTPAEGGA